MKNYPLTREGFLWFLLASAMLVTGLLKSINLITMLSCFLLAVVGLNFYLSRRQLRGLKVRRLIQGPIFAQTPFPVHVQVHNTRRRPGVGLALKDWGPDLKAEWFIPRIKGQESRLLHRLAVLPRRGRHLWGPLQAVCGYPLGLAQRARLLAEPTEVVVLPKLGHLQRGVLRHFLAQASPSIGQARAFPRRHPTAQTEFHGLRSFRMGDSPRWIHWRTSARRGELMVREFEDMPMDNLILIVEPLRPDSPEFQGPARQGEENELVELAVGLAATICWEWCRQKGDHLALALANQNPVVLSGVTSLDLALSMLEALALEPGGLETNHRELLRCLEETDLPAGPILVISTRDRVLADLISQQLHRPVAHVNLASGEQEAFFQLSPPEQADFSTPREKPKPGGRRDR